MSKNPTRKDVAAFVKKLKTSELRYRRLFEAAQDGILILDAKTGMITDVNPFLINMLGYSRDEFVERKLWEVGAFKDIEANQESFEALQENEYIRYEDLPLRAKDGRLIAVEFVSNVYLVEDEKVIQCNIRDITDRKQAQDALLENEALLRELSVRDHLTGLFNRRYLEETLERELLRALRQQSSLGVIMLDVDDFKQINDTYGHVAGDTVLRKLGKLLRKHVRGEDIASRYGGDEFILVLPGASPEVTRERARLICEATKAFHLNIAGKNLDSVTFSLGIAVFPQDSPNMAGLLKAADAALYLAKNAGKGRVAAAGQNPELNVA
ncbi:MAG: sensor domain-containing diguanylate cyclase [Anaerolineae bacterium]|nr:sensor domain-containing diguanylate cyclase [Anaerolineae bacterium]